MQPRYEIGHFLEIEPGVEIYYEDQGHGQPLLFIPGITMSTGVFEKQAAHFSKKYRVICMDPRSQGRSSKVMYGNTYEQHGRDVRMLVEHLDLDDLTMIGWSSGAADLWAYVSLYDTGRLKGAVAIDMPPKPLSHDPADWVEFSLNDMAGVMTELLASTAGQRQLFDDYTRQVMLSKPTDEEVNTIINISMNTPYYIFHTLYTNLVLCNWLPAAKTLDSKIPSLIIMAKHWADTALAYTNKHLPKTKTAVLGGHMMFWDHADEFNQILDNFLEGV